MHTQTSQPRQSFRPYQESRKYSNVNTIKAIIDNSLPFKSNEENDIEKNWYGLENYQDEVIYMSADGVKTLELSLQGSIVENRINFDTLQNNKNLERTLNNFEVKYICLKINGEVFYESYYGHIPSLDIANKFINF